MRPEPEELNLAQAALAAAEAEKLQLKKQLQETEKRLVGLEEEGGHLGTSPAWAEPRGRGGLEAPEPPAPTMPYCSGTAPGEAAPEPILAESDP